METFEEIMTESITNLMDVINVKIQESQSTPVGIEPERSMTRHIITKITNAKYRDNLDSIKRKGLISDTGFLKRLHAHLSPETLGVKNQLDNDYID